MNADGAEKPIIGSDEDDRQKFASFYISLLALSLIDLLTKKFSQIQHLGGLVEPKTTALQQLQALRNSEQITFEYATSAEAANCGALQLIKDIQFLKKTLRQFCWSADTVASEQASKLFTTQSLQPLHCIQLSLAVHPM